MAIEQYRKISNYELGLDANGDVDGTRAMPVTVSLVDRMHNNIDLCKTYICNQPLGLYTFNSMKLTDWNSFWEHLGSPAPDTRSEDREGNFVIGNYNTFFEKRGLDMDIVPPTNMNTIVHFYTSGKKLISGYTKIKIIIHYTCSVAEEWGLRIGYSTEPYSGGIYQQLPIKNGSWFSIDLDPVNSSESRFVQSIAEVPSFMYGQNIYFTFGSYYNYSGNDVEIARINFIGIYPMV